MFYVYMLWTLSVRFTYLAMLQIHANINTGEFSSSFFSWRISFVFVMSRMLDLVHHQLSWTVNHFFPKSILRMILSVLREGQPRCPGVYPFDEISAAEFCFEKLSCSSEVKVSWRPQLRVTPSLPIRLLLHPGVGEECYSFPSIAPLYPWSVPYNAEC